MLYGKSQLMTDYRQSIVLGTHYYRQPTPAAKEWVEDLKRIKQLGIQMIQLRPQWRWNERTEGDYNWDDIDKLLELAGKHELNVIFKPMLETAPDYIFKKYDGYRIGLQGEKMWPIAVDGGVTMSHLAEPKCTAWCLYSRDRLGRQNQF